MNLIRAALFAVFAFMGTVSLSAQNWLPPAAAIPVINAELDVLKNVPMPTTGSTLMSQQQLSDENAKSGGCTDCLLRNVKISMMEMTLVEIKQGADTGTAVEGVRTLMISAANNTPSVLTAINDAYQYMDSIL
jgi:hypothetical protein